ncbi:MAG: hypothetical protein LBT23_08465 [Synergistaceae bacterium]|jgi:hypothetical protein|nr:hypothetical protein [Synergistaceae bacterium]
MFNKIEVSIMRAFFWPVANLVYWGLIFFSWWDTRYRVFIGSSILRHLSERRGFAYIMEHMGEIESHTHIVLAKSEVLPNEFLMIPLVMAVVLFIAPFVVRRDYREPVTGVIVLPAMTLLCYLFASIMNIIVVAAMSAGIYFLLLKTPGPDIFMFMVHPLYLIFPIFKSVPGFLSQCVYLAYIASILITPSSRAAGREEEGLDDDEYYDDPDYPDADDDWDKSACLMEMDRLTRILNSKFDTPSFIDTVRTDVAEYINRRAQIRNDVKLGMAHYKIVLTETKNSMRRVLDADPKSSRAAEAYGFIIDEMERMEYVTPEDSRTMKALFLPGEAPRHAMESTKLTQEPEPLGHTEPIGSPESDKASQAPEHAAESAGKVPSEGSPPQYTPPMYNAEQIINAIIGFAAARKTGQDTEQKTTPEMEQKTDPEPTPTTEPEQASEPERKIEPEAGPDR